MSVPSGWANTRSKGGYRFGTTSFLPIRAAAAWTSAKPEELGTT